MMTTGCSKFTFFSPGERLVIDEQLRVPVSQTVAGRFNAQMIFLADQIERNVERETLQNTFLVTSFTNLNRLSETSAFGRLVAENMIHELQVRKWKVFELRLTNGVAINDAGEFSLSRDINKIKDSYKVGGIVTGTYSVADNHVVVNARVIDIETGLVASSAQAHMPVNWFTEALLADEDRRPMKIVGDTPYGCKDDYVCGKSDSSRQKRNEGVSR